MRLYGLDFTSAPSKQKPLVLATGTIKDNTLVVESLTDLTGPKDHPFQGLEKTLDEPGPWLLATDVPLGMPRGLFEKLSWPKSSWKEFALKIASLSRQDFRRSIESLTVPIPKNEQKSGKTSKLLRLKRETDRVAGSACPMNCVNPPVGLMFHEAVRRLAARDIAVLPQHPAPNCDRFVIEAYSRLVVENLFGARVPYKQPSRQNTKVSTSSGNSRSQILHELFQRLRGKSKTTQGPSVDQIYGFTLKIPAKLEKTCLADDQGDWLDSLLCLVQAAWSFKQRPQGWGIPPDRHSLEGWIVDPKTARLE